MNARRQKVRIDTPSATPLVEQARALAQRLEHVSLRKSRILWELDMPLSRRCGVLAREAQNLAELLEEADQDATAVTARLNLTARLVVLQQEVDKISALAGASVWLPLAIALLEATSVHARPKADARCKEVHDVSVPDETKFMHALEFELGATTLKAFDEITIKEVRSTTDGFEVGAMILVRGEYTLSSEDDAHLMLTVTANEPGQGCTTNGRRNRLAIRRGHGSFELALRIAYDGFPHLWFASDGGKSSKGSVGGVYFGKGAFSKK